MQTIRPTHRLMLFYHVNAVQQNSYYNFILGEFMPTLQKMDLHMLYVWQVYGNPDYQRQVDFICESEAIIRQALVDPNFIRIENRLKSYTMFYRRKVVIYANRYQL